MNVLVIGSGGREHAIARYLAQSKNSSNIFVAPGNGGTATERKTQNVELDTANHEAVVEFCQTQDIGLVVIGPEAPLVAGLADDLREAGVPVFGPGRLGARLEGSKKYAKDFMRRYSIPTADYFSFESHEAEAAHAKVDEMGAPLVVKADGLAAGKGVLIALSIDEAHAAVDLCFSGEFGEAGARVVIEEFLTGPECSLLAFVDGATVVTLSPAQDHKRIGDGDTGANTGGMGVYSPLPLLYKHEYEEMLAIMDKVAQALVAEGIEYRGVLYGGFMLTAEGPKVLEFNARFGDPETQNLLPRLQTDLLSIMYKTAIGELKDEKLLWTLYEGVTVVMASGGYPAEFKKGFEIFGIADAQAIEDVEVFQAGTALNEDGKLVTSGGRVLSVTALAPGFEAAIKKAYEALEKISFEGAYYRMDIGQKAFLAREEHA